jgi:membrane protein required for beta-lactamase induction
MYGELISLGPNDTWNTVKAYMKAQHMNEGRAALIVNKQHLQKLGPLPARCELVVESKDSVLLNFFIKQEYLSREGRDW